MKQEHWRLFTCNFGMSNKLNTLKNGLKNIFKLGFNSSASSGSTLLNHNLSLASTTCHPTCSAKRGRGLRLRIRSEKSYQSRHHQRHSQGQLQSVTASHHLLSRLRNSKSITQNMLPFTICLLHMNVSKYPNPSRT